MRVSILVLAGLCLIGCSASKTEEPTVLRPLTPAPRAVATARKRASVPAKPAKAPPGFTRREPRHSILGRWVDGEGVIYNFQRDEKVSWSRPIGSAEADFKGKYTVTEGVLVIVPEQATSANTKLGKQLNAVTREHRLTQYSLVWQDDGTLLLSGTESKMVLAPVR